MMKPLLTISPFAITVCLTLAGCGDAPTAPAIADPAKNLEETRKVSSTSELKARLEEIAKTASGGSATVGIRPAIDELKATKPQVADSLLSDLSLLEKATSPEEVRAIATRMAGKL
jgi:hypothetical protein